MSRPPASLFPATARPLPLEEVPAVRPPGSAQALRADAAVLLSAARANGGLEVVLARPTPWPTPLEASRANGFDVWEAIGSVPADAASYVLAGDAAGHGPRPDVGEEGWLACADDAQASLGALTAATGGQAGTQAAAARLALLALVLCGAEAAVWDGPQGPDGSVSACAGAVRNLVSGDLPERLAASAASSAALAVCLMHEQRPAGGRRPEAAVYEEARAAAAPLLPGASAALVADLAASFTNGNGFPVDPDAVMHVTGLVAQEDPLADAIDALASARPEWSVHRHGGRLLHLQSGGQPLWRHYRLGSLASPTALARNPELAARSRVNHGALKNPFPEAIRALVATGVDLTGGTPSDCPG